jgi:hypothetical protein
MFTFYADDSGTSPDQPVAIATALIVPNAQIPRLENEWATLKEKEGFSFFHTSEFVHRNPKSEFAGWAKEKQEAVLRRVRQISRKYGLVSFSCAVNKKDYNEVVPNEMKRLTGKHHYTWCLGMVIAAADRWRNRSATIPPFKYVFASMGGSKDKAQQDVEAAMLYCELVAEAAGRSGDYSDYSFRPSKESAALQCVDPIGWTCYNYSLWILSGKPKHDYVDPAWIDYQGPRGPDGWLKAFTMTRKALEKFVAEDLADGRSMARFKDWEERGLLPGKR